MKDETALKSTKTRIVTVRLSDREYQAIKSVTHARGYRNVSELARAAMYSMTVGGEVHVADNLVRRVDEQAMLLLALARDVERLRQIVNGNPESCG